MCSNNIAPIPSHTALRKAAGGTCTKTLESLLVGWSGKDIDERVDGSGKSALHLAAWRGSVKNVEILLARGASVNNIATGEFSYGKTPIFFAITRCRDEVVELLLSRGASCCIVNNKGQSVASLASNHVSPKTLQAVLAAEAAETERKGVDTSADTACWLNFRTTHSDGCTYGDLDPRFLGRALEPSDVATPLSVNPTTKQSRKGNFSRKNPGKSAEEARKRERVGELEAQRTPENVQRRLQLRAEAAANPQCLPEVEQVALSAGTLAAALTTLVCQVARKGHSPLSQSASTTSTSTSTTSSAPPSALAADAVDLAVDGVLSLHRQCKAPWVGDVGVRVAAQVEWARGDEDDVTHERLLGEPQLKLQLKLDLVDLLKLGQHEVSTATSSSAVSKNAPHRDQWWFKMKRKLLFLALDLPAPAPATTPPSPLSTESLSRLYRSGIAASSSANTAKSSSAATSTTSPALLPPTKRVPFEWVDTVSGLAQVRRALERNLERNLGEQRQPSAPADSVPSRAAQESAQSFELLLPPPMLALDTEWCDVSTPSRRGHQGADLFSSESTATTSKSGRRGGKGEAKTAVTVATIQLAFRPLQTSHNDGHGGGDEGDGGGDVSAAAAATKRCKHDNANTPPSSPSSECSCWVIDARPDDRGGVNGGVSCDHEDENGNNGIREDTGDEDDDEYRAALADLLSWAWDTHTIVGFAVSNDLKVLRSALSHHHHQSRSSPPSPPSFSPSSSGDRPFLPSSACLDVQKLASSSHHRQQQQQHLLEKANGLRSVPPPATKAKQLPGLKACVARWLGQEMDKQEQRSDWSRRPLREGQLTYAAADAAILLDLVDAMSLPFLPTAAPSPVASTSALASPAPFPPPPPSPAVLTPVIPSPAPAAAAATSSTLPALDDTPATTGASASDVLLGAKKAAATTDGSGAGEKGPANMPASPVVAGAEAAPLFFSLEDDPSVEPAAASARLQALLVEAFFKAGGELDADAVVALMARHHVERLEMPFSSSSSNAPALPPLPSSPPPLLLSSVASVANLLEADVEEFSSWGVLYAVDVPKMVHLCSLLPRAVETFAAAAAAAPAASGGGKQHTATAFKPEAAAAAAAAVAAGAGAEVVAAAEEDSMFMKMRSESETSAAEGRGASHGGRGGPPAAAAAAAAQAMKFLAEALEEAGGQLEPEKLAALFYRIHLDIAPLPLLLHGEAGAVRALSSLEAKVQARASWGGVHALDARDLLFEALGGSI